MKKIYQALVGVLLLLLLSSLTVTQAQKKRFVILGSSTAGCVGVDPVEKCWTALFTHYYDSTGTGEVFNLALSGYHLYQAMPSSSIPPADRPTPDIYHNITRAVQYYVADAVILNYPSNNYNLYTKKEVMDCFRAIYDTAVSAGKFVYVGTTQPRSSYPEFSTQEARDTLRDLKDSILAVFKDRAIDFWTGIADENGKIKPEYDQGDHIHLNAAGHQILFERVQAKKIFVAGGALPLVNLDFKIQQKNEKVVITWKNDLVNNASVFQLQKSIDGKNFNRLYEAIAAGSNSYSYTDENPAEGYNYYRLEATLKTGAKDYSDVLKIALKSKTFKLEKVYKNNADLVIDFLSRTKQNCFASLINSVGATVFSTQFESKGGSNHIRLHLTTISSGTYFLKLQNASGEMETIPVLLQN